VALSAAPHHQTCRHLLRDRTHPLVYRYVDIGQIGPIPSMYEASWYTIRPL
jgi:hypothetical protein